jgi:hypothetical protein
MGDDATKAKAQLYLSITAAQDAGCVALIGGDF